MAQLFPLPGYALVKLGQGKYRNIVAQAKVYESASSGKLVKIHLKGNEESYAQEYFGALDKTVYWEDLTATSPISIDDEQFTYVKNTDLRGFDDAS